MNDKELRSFFKGKRILVTGGTGSVGSEIVKQILEYNPDVVRIFDNDETGLFNLKEELKNLKKSYNKTRYLLGDVRDIDRLRWAVRNIDIIFHAAALKHVPLCENNPFDAVKTNVIGTQNVIEVAMEMGLERMVTISTDKAVNPVNVMGATKLLAERLTISANLYKGDEPTLFSCVRFGNVLDSRGSVIPIFREQIKKGGPLTLTDREMTRFVMSLSQAVELVLKATTTMDGGEIFILKMPRINIADLAEVMIETTSPLYGHDPSSIKITNLGIRDGEKMHEELITKEEASNAIETESMYIIHQKSVTKGPKLIDIETLKNSKFLDKSEIKNIIFKAGKK
ncbi:polysaccharide biosynthesis protein [Candidatus Pacearchaeota archaeon]|nr:polysaccharide biosynthesis protein [Candidatus Pacearchaeota archaeon]